MKAQEKIGDFFKSISNPVRTQILMAIGTGEACVCHLEATLGLRQAYISQQLMILRKKKIIKSRREGKYIFYRVVKPEVLELIRTAADIVGVPGNVLAMQDHMKCECPKCEANQATTHQQEHVLGDTP